MAIHSGIIENIPYSLSRWTDLPLAKWPWFEACLESGKMVAFDPRTAVPKLWSLHPKDTLGLVFWTKNPMNLIQHRQKLEKYSVNLHITATGWYEVEKGAPTLFESGALLVKAARIFPQTYWRFSPVPILPEKELLLRFRVLLGYATMAKINHVVVSFIQPNDRLLETRSLQERFELLNKMASEGEKFGVKIVLCADDQSFKDWSGALFETDICVKSEDFINRKPDSVLYLDTCGCVMMADPFTVNEVCSCSCTYCYAGDKNLSSQRTTHA